MSRALKITLISLLIIAIISFTGLFILLMNGKINFDFLKSELVYNENIEEVFNTIQISTTSLDVRLIKSDSEKVNVKVYDRDDSGLSVKVENNTLLIEKDNRIISHFLNFGKREVIISLPEQEYNFILKSTSGDISSEVDLKMANIVTTSGDIKLQKVDDLNIKVTSGDINIKEANNVNINSTSGDVEIYKINNSLDVDTTSGDININELTITKNSSIDVISGDVLIHKSSSNIYYNTKVISGDVRIDNNNRHADYELSINTKSGDISVQ